MKAHIIIDYSFLYYKYKFQLESGKMKRLTQLMEWHGANIEKDVSQIYYSMREIESFRRHALNQWDTVVVSVCFDMPSIRNDDDTESATKYKSNRGKKLSEDDFENIQFVYDTLVRAGYNCYKYDGLEADDLVSYLVRHYKESFDATFIYTPDADLLVNVSDTVVVSRYKSGKGYTVVSMDDFTDYLSAELKCHMPYNALMLYKCTVGDKSDCIDGIKKFGPKAFDKMVDFLDQLHINWEKIGNYEGTSLVLEHLHKSGYFNDDQYRQAVESLSLVRPAVIDFEIPVPNKVSTVETRQAAYGPYSMNSLIS